MSKLMTLGMILLFALQVGAETSKVTRQSRRYSDHLFVQHKKKDVWSSERGRGGNVFMNDPQHLYQLMFMGQTSWSQEN